MLCFIGATTNATLAFIYRKLFPRANNSQALVNETDSKMNQTTTEKNENNIINATNIDSSNINSTLIDTASKSNLGVKLNPNILKEQEWIKIIDPSKKMESKVSYIKQKERDHERSASSIEQKKNTKTKSLTNSSLYSTSNISNYSLLNITILSTTPFVEEQIENNSKPHMVAKIFKIVNESARSSELPFSNNYSLSNISTVANMKRLSYETTKPTKTMKNVDLKTNAGFVVFFVFLVIFSVAAPLGKTNCYSISFFNYYVLKVL